MLFAKVFTLAFASSMFVPPHYGDIADFSFLERNGQKIERKDLLGKIWIADFIFTRCGGPCPLITSRMSALQKELLPAVQFVSFTVDPTYDTPRILARYAESYGAEKDRWYFLTGDKKELYQLIRGSFYIGIEENKAAKNIDEEFIHSLHFVLVDPKGQIRSYYIATDPDDLKRIPRDVKMLSLENVHPLILRLPSLNALLNSLCAIFLVIGYQCIRMKKVLQHKICMTSAFAISVAFLTSYLIYHVHAGFVPFQGTGWIRPVYFAILISHVLLAIAIVPLALVTFYRAWKEQFDKHKRIARWTLPLWLYVSVTGVTVYWMLYHIG